MTTTEVQPAPLPTTDAPLATADAPALLHQTIIEPAKGWQLINASELWKNRELLFFLVWRDVKVRYKQTLLGAAWAILQPVMLMIVFTVFFGRMAKVDTGSVPYPIFVFAGLLPWTFFSTAIASAGNSVVGSERLITKIYFPRLAIPFAAVGAAIVDFLLALTVLVGMMLWYRVTPSLSLLYLPPLMLFVTLAALGVGTLLAALNVAYRDFRYVIPFLVQLWMFATPSIYQRLLADTGQYSFGHGHWLLAINPLTGIIQAFRAAILHDPMPWNLLALNTATTIALFFAGCLYFRKVEDSFADKI